MVVVSNDFIMHNRVTSILGWVGCKSCEYSLEKC